MLDAKAAFDVVCHSHIMRRLYYAGVNDGLWSLIKSLHENASSVVKMSGSTSQPFDIHQGVRQGGILSTDLYKLYVNPLLYQYTDSGVGARIGTILNNNCACADDVCIMSIAPENT